MARRLKTKKRAEGRGRFMRFVEKVVALTALGGLGFGLYAFAEKSKEFEVRQMHIEGRYLVAEDEIAIASGVTQDDNLLLIRCNSIASRIEALPAIKSAEVHRVFPDTLHVTVTERVPVATVLLRNHLYEIDEDCVVIREIDGAIEHTGPFITGYNELSVLEPGQQVEAPALREALTVWNAFQETELAKNISVSELAAYSQNDIRMYCEELNYELRWGRGDYDRQARRLDLLWARQDGALGCYEYLDLRFGTMLACK
jgi:cell division protein FtsQ